MKDNLVMKEFPLKAKMPITRRMHRKYRFISLYGYKGDWLIKGFSEWLKECEKEGMALTDGAKA